MIDRICKVSCEEGKNGNEDKEVCSFKLSCVLGYGFGDLWDGKYGYCSGSICKIKSKLVRAALYYITIALLMLDPLYLSIICPLVGGGDMNGIKLIFPEVVARVVFGMLFIINGVLFWKKVLPSYKMAFSE